MIPGMVSIIIPTKNEISSIGKCLEAIKSQDYDNIEIIIVDKDSCDGTRKIAEEFGAMVLSHDSRPLGARFHGLKNSNGEFIVLLDADQVLSTNTISRGVEMLRTYDLLALEERSYEPSNWVHHSIDRQRMNKHKLAESSNRPLDYLYARMFKRDILMKAYNMIPEDLINRIWVYDDGILHNKLITISTNVGLLPNAVRHMEEKNVLILFQHWIGLGRGAKESISYIKEKDLITWKPMIEGLRDALKNSHLRVTLISRLGFLIGKYLG